MLAGPTSVLKQGEQALLVLFGLTGVTVSSVPCKDSVCSLGNVGLLEPAHTQPNLRSTLNRSVVSFNLERRAVATSLNAKNGNNVKSKSSKNDCILVRSAFEQACLSQLWGTRGPRPGEPPGRSARCVL